MVMTWIIFIAQVNMSWLCLEMLYQNMRRQPAPTPAYRGETVQILGVIWSAYGTDSAFATPRRGYE